MVTTVANPDALESEKEILAFDREDVIKLLQGLKVFLTFDCYKEYSLLHEAGAYPRPVGVAWRKRHVTGSAGWPYTLTSRSTCNLQSTESQRPVLKTGRRQRPRSCDSHFSYVTLPSHDFNTLMGWASGIVHERFTAAGMLAGSPALPAKPNLTLINTANRQSYVPAPGVKRKPFSLEALYRLDGFKAFRAMELPGDLALPLKVDLGAAEVGRLELSRVMPGLPSDNTTVLHEAEVAFST
jgi:hypothetical protein